MPDYIQLLESKLSPDQKQALNAMTDVARARGITVYLTGGAVRDIVSGASVRDLDITVQANPLKFRKDMEKAGFAITGQHEPSQTVYLRYGQQARLEISAARTESFPKPAHPEYRLTAGILDDLRRRDFTANAMALSLNEGSWGLLLDPLNGTADIYARQLRIVSNYGFLEDPIRMVRAVRLLSRTGWELEERTRVRYDNAKAENVISAISAIQRGYELEEIAYEEEPLQVIKALEAEGWMEHLFPHWTSRSADVPGLERLHERLVQLLMAGLQPDPSSAQFRLLTAKISSAHLSALKRLFVRADLIQEADVLDKDAKKVLQQMTAKDAAKPSQLWKLLHSAKPEAVLWLFFTGKGAAIQNRFSNFFAAWPEARQKIPNAILQDMRILPDVAGYEELLNKLTFAFMDAELPDEEAIRKFAEPYSPPAPPPPVIVRRSRTVKRVVESKASKAKGKKAGKKAIEGSVEAGTTAPGEEAAHVAPVAEVVTGTAASKAGTKSGTAQGKTAAAKGARSTTKDAKAEKMQAAGGKADIVKTGKTKDGKAKPPAVKPSSSKSGKENKAAKTIKSKETKGKGRKTVKGSVRPAVRTHAAAKGLAKTAPKRIVKPRIASGSGKKASTKKIAVQKAKAADKRPSKPVPKVLKSKNKPSAKPKATKKKKSVK